MQVIGLFFMVSEDNRIAICITCLTEIEIRGEMYTSIKIVTLSLSAIMHSQYLYWARYFWRLCAPCSLTEGKEVVLSTHCSTAAAAPEGLALSHRWLVGTAAWTLCRLERQPSLPELLKASFWDSTLQMRSWLLTYSCNSHQLTEEMLQENS